MLSLSLSLVEAQLPAGFRFHPRDDELVCDYLMKKEHHLFIQVDLNNCEPWDLPESACVGGKEWYFYSQRDKKYATGSRTNRATLSGYWKATGKDRAVVRKGCLVGMRKTLVFYQGRAPKGKKSDWVMHEFRLEPPPPNKEDWVLCRVFHKSSYDDNKKKMKMMSCSSPLALMEPYITNTLNHGDNHQQVPCFSIFTPSSVDHHQPQTSTTPPLLSHTSAINNMMMLGGFHTSSNNNVSCISAASSSSCCDNTNNNNSEILEAVLEHLTGIDNIDNPSTNMMTMKESPPPPSFGGDHQQQGSSSESFLSISDDQVALADSSSMWNLHHQF